MTLKAINQLIGHMRRAAARPDAADPTDGDLLERYLRRPDQAAFETLVRRHGPMVLGVCRRVLRNEADAEDAFQATFLVLVRKAASIRSRGQLGNWLYGVAHNTALKARAMNLKRRVKEREAGAVPKPEAVQEVWNQVQALLDAELSRLPDKYRVPIVLCELEGQTVTETARQLGWPRGTVATRLSRGRALLARRLARHGLALSGGVLTAVLAHGTATGGVPVGLMLSTVRAATGGVVSAGVVDLTGRVVQGMFLKKLKAVTALLAITFLVAGAGWMALRVVGAGQVVAGERPAGGPGHDQIPPSPSPGWIRVHAEGKSLLFRPDGTGRTEAAAVAFQKLPSPDGKRILSAGEAGDPAVYVADADGKNARKVSPDKADAGFPCWSPDGRRIALTVLHDQYWQIHVADADGGNTKQVTHAPHGTAMPKFAPDGRLSYLSYRKRQNKLQPGDLMLGEGEDASAVVKDVFVTDYAWSPDGKTVAYGKPGALVFHDVESGKAREVAFPDIDKQLAGHGAWRICWSLDGRAVVCSIRFLGDRQQGTKIFGDDELFVIPRDGKPSWFRPEAKVLAIDWVKHEAGPEAPQEGRAGGALPPPAGRELDRLNAKIADAGWALAVDVEERPWAFPDDRKSVEEASIFVRGARKRLADSGVRVRWDPERQRYEAAGRLTPGSVAEPGESLGDLVAARFIKDLKALRSPFLGEKRLEAVRREIRDFVAAYGRVDMTAEDREKLLAAVDEHVTRHFWPFRDGQAAQVEELAYLGLPDLVRNFEWLLARALTRGPLSPEQGRALREQRAWLHEFLAGLPVRPNDVPEKLSPELVRRDAMAGLAREQADPLGMLCDPMSDEQFEAFKKDLKEFKDAEVGLPGTVSNVPFRALMIRAGGMPPGFHDRIVSLYGDGDGRAATRFASNGWFHTKGHHLMGWRVFKGQRPVFDMVGSAELNLPEEVAGEPDDPAVVEWLRREGKGEFLFLPESATLRAVRGARLAVLEASNWMEADGLSDAQLRKELAARGTTNVSAKALRGYNGVVSADAPRVFVAVENAEKRLAVVLLHRREFGQLYFGCRTR